MPAAVASVATSPGASHTEAEVGARSTRHAAWIAAVAAIVAALIAIVGVFWTGYKSDETSTKAAEIGARAGVEAAQTQVTGETERARAEFLRSKQLILYSRLAEQMQVVQDDFRRLEEEPSGRDQRRYRRELNDAISRLVNNKYQMRIIATTGTYASFGHLTDGYKRSAYFLEVYQDSDAKSDGWAKDAEAKYDRSASESADATRAFFEAVRADIGPR